MHRSLLLLGAVALGCGSSSEPPRKLVILHTNDEHSHVIGCCPEVDDFPTPALAGTGIKGGASRRAAVLATERAGRRRLALMPSPRPGFPPYLSWVWRPEGRAPGAQPMGPPPAGRSFT